jgi:DNA-binding NarL/FixJ family response regulator
LDHPDLPILVISPDLNAESVQTVLEAGAMGYLSIDVSQDELVRGIYAISHGEIFLESPVLVNLLSRQIASSSYELSLRQEDFSPREQEVLSCLTRGMSDRDIAQTLFISVRTVQTHLAHIYEKMDVHSRTEAALMAVHAGWLSLVENKAADKNQ